MLAILAAATVISTPSPSVRAVPDIPTIAPLPEACLAFRHEIADSALLYREDGKAKFSPLSQLPKANHEKAVLRSVAGCSAPVVVRYGAGR